MRLALGNVARSVLVLFVAAGMLSAIVLARGTPRSAGGSTDPSATPAATPVAAASVGPQASAADPAEPAVAGLSDAERRPQLTSGARYGDCRGMLVTLDEATPTIELATATADLTVVATVDEIGGGRYNTPAGEELTAADSRTLYDAYRPTILRIDAVVAGGAPAMTIKVRLPGGQVGCDEYHVEGIDRVESGQQYVLFLRALPDAKGNRAPEMTVVRAWPVDARGEVSTPADGRLTIAQFAERARP